jgi:hypothetical protein
MAQDYTRQSTFADGDTITAALFNDEYNQLVNVFAYSSTSESATGHRHDGTAAQGGNIPQIGDLDFNNKIVVDDTNNRWGFFVEVSSTAVEQIRVQDGAIVPVTTNDIDLGTSSLQFKNLYIDGTATIDDLTVDASVVIGTTLSVSGTTTLSGDVTLGNASADTLVVSALVNSNFVPETDSLWNLGSTSLYWANAYVDAVTTTGNVAVGGNLTVTGDATINGNLTFGNADTDSITIGAEIDSNLVPNTDDTYDLGSSTKEWRNLYIDGTANIDSLVADTADINAGTIDNTTIGGSTAAAGTFSSLVATTADINAGSIDNTTIGATTASTGNFSTLSIAGTAITATAAELNIMDGVTATATEINVLDGITSTTAELNILDGVTATASELNLVDGSSAGTVVNSKAVIYGAAGEVNATTLQVGGVAITSTPAELNILDGVTATTAELNILDGVTSTTAELNILDGVTATAAELNVLDGVTAFVDEDDMVSNSATSIPSQQSVKAYVDSQVASSDTLSELTDTNITTPADNEVLAYDSTSTKWINQTAAEAGLATSAQGTLADSALQPADLSVTTNAVGTAALTYTSGTGVFSYTPPDLSGYLTSYTETDPVVGAINGIVKADGAGNISAAVAGTDYLSSYTETDTLDSVTGRGATTANSISVGGLTVDTDTLVVDSTNNRVGIGTTNPSGIGGGADLAVIKSGGARFVLNNSSRQWAIRGDSGIDDLRITARGSSDTVDIDYLTVTSTGNVGIGDTAPAAKLEVNGGAADYTSSATGTGLFHVSGGASSEYAFYVGVADQGVQLGHNGGGSRFLSFETNETERVRITSAGSVCVGDEDPDEDGPSSRLYVCSEDNNTGVSNNTNIPDIFVGAHSTAGSSGSGGEIRFGARAFGTSGFAAIKGFVTNGAANGNVGHLDINMRAATTDTSYTRRFRFEYDGDFHADGNVVAYSTTVSDIRLKENIETVEGALDKIEAIRGVTFDRTDTGKRSAGVIAQELEPHLPEAIVESSLPLKTGNDDELYKLVEYDAIHALTIEGIKELVAEVRSLRAEVEALKNGASV